MTDFYLSKQTAVVGAQKSTTLNDLVTALTDGRMRPSTAVVEALARLDLVEPEIHAWTHVDRSKALEKARQLDYCDTTAPLRGVPFGVKDIIDVQGLTTECGSPLRKGRVAERDAPIVTRLRELGAIPLGKRLRQSSRTFNPARPETRTGFLTRRAARRVDRLPPSRRESSHSP